MTTLGTGGSIGGVGFAGGVAVGAGNEQLRTDPEIIGISLGDPVGSGVGVGEGDGDGVGAGVAVCDGGLGVGVGKSQLQQYMNESIPI